MARKQRVYIIGPYTVGNQLENVKAAIMAAEEVMRRGGIPFVPHLNHFWHILKPHDWHTWMEWCFEWLSLCDCAVRVPGESKGGDLEQEKCEAAGKPVYPPDQMPDTFEAVSDE